MGSWSQLPEHLLGLIIERLSLTDYVRFGCVCTWWNLIVMKKDYRLKPQYPWLMLPGHDDYTSARFLSLSENRTYNIPLPPPSFKHRKCIGSSFGWLITLDHTLEMHLLNPITRVQIQLPSIATLPFIHNSFGDEGYLNQDENICGRVSCSYNLFFRRAILSSAPSSDGSGEFTIILINWGYNTSCQLTIMRSRDSTWTALECPRHITDVAHHKGQLFTLVDDGTVQVWDQNGLSFTLKATMTEQDIDFSWNYKILVQPLVPTNELFMIVRQREESISEYKLLLFVLDERKFKWVEAKDRKNHVFFSSPGMELPERMQNSSMYLAEVVYSLSQLSHVCSRYALDMGVLDMRNWISTPVEIPSLHITSSQPLWVTPTLS